MVPERLSDYALQSISACCKPTVFLTDGKSQARRFCAVGPVKNCKHVVATAVGLFKDASV